MSIRFMLTNDPPDTAPQILPSTNIEGRIEYSKKTLHDRNYRPRDRSTSDASCGGPPTRHRMDVDKTFAGHETGSMLANEHLHSSVRPSLVARWVASQSLPFLTQTKLDSGTAPSVDGWIGGPSSSEGQQTFEEPTCSLPDLVQESATDVQNDANQGMHMYRAWSAQPEHSSLTDNRRSRRAYSPEQKLFIMYHRILKDTKWQDISAGFGTVFGEDVTDRTIRTLRSTYYRTRRDWGLDYVTRTAQRPKSDKAVVLERMKRLGFCSDYRPWNICSVD
ncbi:hypothetical protein KC343_g338 [Hortaea werneckii]|nr:hypothetical protein KC342_g3773 [Hortaea werneckii]KAI6852815.1 hypothetical protein KC350_g545 [Hortaea werneckii]KAI7291078.1 hypothetical protein KC352_g2885 [Hortaea werneckii]KAI7311013.1 hypothetical protein KC326_g6451 [Hortaea werneckii]KAI7317508.1 hypothetical protein KC340_g8318 [Hortaea werneckii]